MREFIKIALRSRSLTFPKQVSEGTPTGRLLTVAYNGRTMSYREGTSDGLLLYEILFRGEESEYWSTELPKDDVRVVLDIGANIGTASLYFKTMYPGAQVHAFEPVPSNFDILKKNTEGLATCHNIGLSNSDGSLEMIQSPQLANQGGWSFYQRGAVGGEARMTVPVRKSGDVFRELGLDRIDVIKIDTEGAEREILQGMTDAQLATVRYIVGELHGEQDFQLLDWLQQRGFDLDLHKRFGRNCFIFRAKGAVRH